MHIVANINIFAEKKYADRTAAFRCRDNYSLSDKRKCLRINAGESVEFAFEAEPAALKPGLAEVVFQGSLEIFGSTAYASRHINSVMEVTLNGTTVFDGVIHWRSHEETAAYWPIFNFYCNASLLQPGSNTVALKNKTSVRALGEFFDRGLADTIGAEKLARKLETLYLCAVEVNVVKDPERFPHLAGVPRCAIAGAPFVVEVNTGGTRREVANVANENAAVAALGTEFEFGAYRTLFKVIPSGAGLPLSVGFDAGGTRLSASVPVIYANRHSEPLVAGPGTETTYWHNLKRGLVDFYELGNGTAFRISLDDFLANLHFIPKEKWALFVQYIVRRKIYFTFQRLRVPPYARVQPDDLKELADMGGKLFIGTCIPEPYQKLFRITCEERDLGARMRKIRENFRTLMDEYRLPGCPLMTFDVGGALCGNYYDMGLDVHLQEIGPGCNCFDEICCRGGATAYGKPWGVATAMHWYCGQGALYAADEGRVRLAKLIMLSSYLAGARYILWEGGMFDNLPVYNFILTEESWRDYNRRYDHPGIVALRASFRDLMEFHQSQQLPPPKVDYGIIKGVNDSMVGTFDSSTSAFGTMIMARAWSLVSVFLPHFSWGRDRQEHGRPLKRWYSPTPHGQVDVVPAASAPEHLAKYKVLALLGWNTMTPDLYAKMVGYAKGGGTLFLALPHCVTDTIEKLEWSFYNNGDLEELCGVQASEVGNRIERVKFAGDEFLTHLPREVTLTEKNPLFIEDFDEMYPAFGIDTAYLCGTIAVKDADVLATNQSGGPVLLRKKIGKGVVYFLNTWTHPGHGRLKNLAAGILETLIAKTKPVFRVNDPTENVAWFEYPAENFTRYFLLNTDWTKAGNVADVQVIIGNDILPVKAREGVPLQIVSDGTAHVLIADPEVQVMDWKTGANGVEIVTTGGNASSIRRFDRGRRTP